MLQTSRTTRVAGWRTVLLASTREGLPSSNSSKTSKVSFQERRELAI